MTRWLLAVAALLGPLTGLVSADYVIIKIDLNKFLPSKADAQQGGSGMPGMGMMGGMPGLGMPGGGMGMMGGGMPGYGTSGGMPGYGASGGKPGFGAGGGMPGYGASGGKPGFGVSGGAPGFGGGAGGPPGYGSGPGGRPGGRGGPPGMGMMGGMPGMGMMGGTPGAGGTPGDPNSGEAKEVEYQPLWAYAYLELKQRPKVINSTDGSGCTWVLIPNKWGQPAYVPLEAISGYIQQRSLAKRWETKLKNDLKDKTAENLLALAEWALERGLLDGFLKMIDELKEVAPTNATLLTVEKARAAMKSAPGQDDPAAASLAKALSAEGYRALRSELGHYTLLTNARNAAEDPSIKRRLARMEETYQTFFYWFALKGKPQTVPAYRLVTVLAKDRDPESTKEFESKHALFDEVPMLADGFTARRDNTVVLSSRRMDEAFSTLTRNNAQLFKNEFKVTASELLKQANILQKRKDLGCCGPVLQTLALLQNAMEEESEAATVTHECVRQLEAATGLIPRNVNAAEWAQFGLASFFETPIRSFYPAHGAPNWNQLINFKYLVKVKKLDPKRAREVLLNVITDTYFRQAYRSLRRQGDGADEKDKEKLANKTANELEVARATGWGLTYYLAHNHLNQLLAFYDEVSKLPRDIEYDAEALKACFGRAFNLLTPDPNAPGQQTLDRGRLQRLANDWFNKMATTQLDMIEVETEGLDSRRRASMEANAPKANPNPQTNPGGQSPFGPGGMGGRSPYGPGGPGMGRPGPGGGRPGGGGPGGGRGGS